MKRALTLRGMFKESPYFKEEIRGTPYPKKGERQILRRSLAEKAITILEKTVAIKGLTFLEDLEDYPPHQASLAPLIRGLHLTREDQIGCNHHPVGDGTHGLRRVIGILRC